MILLPNGCKCSEPKVHPTTWKRLNASIKSDWYIHYRFYDPVFKDKHPKGYSKRIKGMNVFKTLHERQAAATTLLEHELSILRKGYNPITETTIGEPEPTPDTEYIIHPSTPFVKAMEQAYPRMLVSAETKLNLKSIIKYVSQAATQLRLADKPITDIRRRHVVMLLDRCEKIKDTFTANTYNQYRSHLRMIFKELVMIEAIEHNPVDENISKRKTKKVLKTILTEAEIDIINTQLKAANPRLWRFVHIFCNSGARTTEILQVRKEDIDLKNLMVRYTINKGKVREIRRPIKRSVLHLWQQVYQEAHMGQCVFSAGLLPGAQPIRREQITRRWQLWVKEKLKIKADWYSLKHLNTDDVDTRYGTDVAAQLNQHSPAMVRDHYAVSSKQRIDNLIKQAPNPLYKPKAANP